MVKLLGFLVLMTLTQAAIAQPIPSNVWIQPLPVPVTLSAAGTTQGTATLLTTSQNIVTTVAAGSGVIIAGMSYPTQSVVNAGANPLLVYPNSGAQFGTSGTNVAFTISVNGIATFVCTSATQCYVKGS
jgi:hypothetical protein